MEGINRMASIHFCVGIYYSVGCRRVEEKCCNAEFGWKSGRKETAVKNEAWLAIFYRQRAAGCWMDSSGLVAELVGNSCWHCPRSSVDSTGVLYSTD
jgi:hypothetical protein